MPTEQQTKELQTRLQLFRLVSRINKGDTTAIIDELLALLEHFKTLPKGDKGEKGEKGEKGDKGERGDVGKGKDGKDYVLTDKDKKDIANKIKVPVVERIIEKVEVIKEQPLITQQIREIAFSDTPEQIQEKIKTFKEAWLEISQIKGFEEYMRGFGNNFLEQAKSFVPRALNSLYDVQVNSEPTEGQTLTWSTTKKKWIPGTAVGGNASLTLLAATGTVDGINTAFTFTTKPTYIVSDGAWYTENNGWTWSGSTATMSVPPQSVIWGFA